MLSLVASRKNLARVSFGAHARALVLPLLALCFAGCATQATYSPETPVASLPDLQSANLQTKWLQQLPTVPGEKATKLWVVDHDLAVLTNQNYLHGVKATNGLFNYHIELNYRLHNPTRPLNYDSQTIAISDVAGVALYSTTSDQLIQYAPFDFAAGTSPIKINKYFLVGANYENFVCTYAEYQGNTPNTREPFMTGQRRWIVQSPNDAFNIQPIQISKNSIFIASQSGKLWVVNYETGEHLWMHHQVNGSIVTDVTYDAGRVFIPCLNHHLYAFEALTGTRIWDTFLEGKLDQTPVVFKDTVFQAATGKGLYALSVKDGTTKWFQSDATRVVGVLGTSVIAQDQGKNLLVINAKNGQIENRLAISNVQDLVVDANTTLYILTQDGRLTAIEKKTN